MDLRRIIDQPRYARLKSAEEMLSEGTPVERFLGSINEGVYPFEDMETVLERVRRERQELEERHGFGE
jgi:hypothetical protein